MRWNSEVAAVPGIPDFAEGHFFREAHAVLLKRQGDLAAVMRVVRDEVAHPADRLALKKVDAPARLDSFAEESFDRGAGGSEGGDQALAIEFGIAVEGPCIAGEAHAVVFEPAGMNLLHVGKLFGDGSSARSKRHSVETLFGDGASQLDVDGAVDAPGLEDLFEQGAVAHGDSWMCIATRAETEEKNLTQRAQRPEHRGHGEEVQLRWRELNFGLAPAVRVR